MDLTCDNQDPHEPGGQVIFHVIVEVARESCLQLCDGSNQKRQPKYSNSADEQPVRHLCMTCMLLTSRAALEKDKIHKIPAHVACKYCGILLQPKGGKQQDLQIAESMP